MDSRSETCPACGAINWSTDEIVKDHSISSEDFTLVECLECHLKITRDAPSQEMIGPYYVSEDYISHSDVQNDLKDKLYHRARNIMLQSKARWLEGSLASKGKLLDVGSGTGYFLQHMNKRGWEVTGLEPDKGARTMAIEKWNLDIRESSEIYQLQEKYDAITMWHVLEHVHDLDGYLKRFSEMLTEDGFLIIAVPNHNSADREIYGTHWAAYDTPRHLWHFTAQSMEVFLQKRGFSLSAKKRMILDPFYVSLLSEKYKNGNSSLLRAGWSGIRSTIASFVNKDRSSSIVYIAKKIQ